MSWALQAQNLVPNPGFETASRCPSGYSDHTTDFRVIEWSSANTATPDYFNSCSKGNAGVPYNWAGISDAFEGNGYAGIYVWINSDKNYREYVTCRLIEPLVKDSVYRVSFRYKLASYSRFSIDRVGVALLNAAIKVNNDELLNIQSLETVRDTSFDQHTGSWQLFEHTITAAGGEQFLAIGNFTSNALTRSYKIKHSASQQEMLEKSAYYYLDDVQVIPKSKVVKPLVAAFQSDSVAINHAYVLRNVQFRYNSYYLQGNSAQELSDLAAYLLANTQFNILISGHTDDVGSSDYNLTLSIRRAQTVAQYLESKGIDTKRITATGFGERVPLFKTSDEVSRRENRRVEIVFVKQ